MANFTPNLNLAVTPETTNKSFKAWRLEMDNDTNSNMTKIDDAFGELSNTGTSLGTMNIATFDGGKGALPLNSCVIDLHRETTGSGDPSITNIHSLRSYTKVTFHHTGKNLIDQTELQPPSSKTEVTSITWNGTTATISVDNTNWAIPRVDPITLKAGVTYTLSAYLKINQFAEATNYYPAVCLRRVRDFTIQVSGRLPVGETEGYVSVSYTPSEDLPVWPGVVLTGSTNDSCEVQVSKLQLEIGSSRTTYEAYKGEKLEYDFSDLGLVGEATFDVLTGELKVNRLIEQFDGGENWRSYGTGESIYFYVYTNRGRGLQSRACSHFPNASVNSSNTTVGFSYGTKNSPYTLIFRHPTITTLEDWTAWLEEQASNGTPLTCRFALETPIVRRYDPAFISTLSSTNYIFADENNVILKIGGTISSVQNEVQTLGQVIKEDMETINPIIKSTTYGPSNIVSIESASGSFPLKSCSVTISAFQEGSGTPSLTNVRPIHGYNSITVYRAGKNLVNNLRAGTQYDGPYVNGDVLSDGRFSLSRKENSTTTSTVTLNPLRNYTNSETDLLFEQPDLFVLESGKPYIVQDCTLGGFSGLTRDRVAINTGVLLVGEHRLLRYTPEEDIHVKQVRAYISATYAYDGEFMYEPMVTAEDSASFEEYRGKAMSFDFSSTAGTVFGGTLDLLSGVLSVDKIGKVFDGTEDWVASSSGTNIYYTYKDARGRAELGLSNRGCSHFANVTVSPSTTKIGYYTTYPAADPSMTWLRFRPGVSSVTNLSTWKAWLAEQSANGTPLSCWWKLNTPITYQLTPQTISTIDGVNNLWADCGPVTVEYGAFLQALQQEIESFAATIEALSN